MNPKSIYKKTKIKQYNSFVEWWAFCVLLWAPVVGYTMRDIRYIWRDGLSSVGMSSEVELPQFRVLGHRQRATEINLTTGTHQKKKKKKKELPLFLSLTLSLSTKLSFITTSPRLWKETFHHSKKTHRHTHERHTISTLHSLTHSHMSHHFAGDDFFLTFVEFKENMISLCFRKRIPVLIFIF